VSGRYLTELAGWLRAAGLEVVEVAGWPTRARSSGGYSSGRPTCIMWHHTASSVSWDGQRDADYCATGDPDAPLANLYLDRAGRVWILAAGATNTNGKGGPVTVSRGQVPADSMNSYAVGIEFGNNGVGETWPQAQIDAGFVTSTTLTARLGLDPGDVGTHTWWTTRKIDPATATAVAGPWQPRSVNSSGSWSRDDLVAECRRRATTPPAPTPEPEPEEDDMPQPLLVRNTAGSPFVIDANVTGKFALWSEDWQALAATGQYVVCEGMRDDTIDRIPTVGAPTDWREVP